MLSFIYAVFRSTLIGTLELAVGCLLPVFANHFTTQGAALNAGGRAKRCAVSLAAAFAGMLLPFGSFGAIPVVAAGWLAGLDLPLVLPLLVSNFIFNLSMPLTDAVFVWSGNIVRIAAALGAGALSGVWLLRSGGKAGNILRAAAFSRFFEGHRGKRNYLSIFRDYFESAGLFILAAALLQAFLAQYAGPWLQGSFFGSAIGMSVANGMSRLNVFNPFFGAALQILGRLLDFSALASLILLLRVRQVTKIYILCIALAALLSVSLVL